MSRGRGWVVRKLSFWRVLDSLSALAKSYAKQYGLPRRQKSSITKRTGTAWNVRLDSLQGEFAKAFDTLVPSEVPVERPREADAGVGVLRTLAGNPREPAAARPKGSGDNRPALGGTGAEAQVGRRNTLAGKTRELVPGENDQGQVTLSHWSHSDLHGQSIDPQHHDRRWKTHCINAR